MHSVAEIKAALSHMPAKEDLAVWRRDERKGVQRLLASYDKRCARMAAEKERLAALMEPERIFGNKDLSMSLEPMRRVEGR